MRTQKSPKTHVISRISGVQTSWVRKKQKHKCFLNLTRNLMACLNVTYIAKQMIHPYEERFLSADIAPLTKVLQAALAKHVKDDIIKTNFELRHIRVVEALRNFILALQRYRAYFISSAIDAGEFFDNMNEYTSCFTKCYREIRQLAETIFIVRKTTAGDVMPFMYAISNDLVAMSMLLPDIYEMWFILISRIYKN